MTGEKNKRSLFALSNSAFVQSLSNMDSNYLEGKRIPTTIASSIVSRILDNFHERLTNDMISGDPQSVRAQRNLEKLESISIENFSTQQYSQIDHNIVIKTLTSSTNIFKSLDLTNVRVADDEHSVRSIVINVNDTNIDVPPPILVDIEPSDESDIERDTNPMEIVVSREQLRAKAHTHRIYNFMVKNNVQIGIIKCRELSSLSLPRLIPEERLSGNRVRAVNRFVLDHMDFAEDAKDSALSIVRISQTLLPQLTSLSLGLCSCIRLDQWSPPVLTHLNLSHINSRNFPVEVLSITEFPISILAPTLKSLTLYQTEFNRTFLLKQIYACSKLEFLDISATPLTDRSEVYSLERPDPSGVFEMSDIINNLPKLHSLDVSGTPTGANLKFNKLITCSGESGRLRIDIPDLSRVIHPGWLNRLPLSYLGLWGCDINFERMEMLANNIAGNRDARQMLISAQRWRNEPAMASQIWNAIFDFLKNNTETSIFLEECILTFNKYYRDEFKLPLILSANMFYLVNPDPLENSMDILLKQKSLKCLIRCINFNLGAVRVIRNCLLTMSKFNLPDDLLFIYETSALTMLKVLSKYHVTPSQTRREDADFLTNMVIQFANQFVCQVDLNLKLATRRIKFIDTICLVIEKRLDNHSEPDEPLKGCWSCLWNVTDETPSNSERFIQRGGVKLFLRCLKKFPNDTELKRNIMGLVGNIAEVDYLRKHLIRDETIHFYSDALDSEGLEVAYNACGTLSHILSDQSSLWPESLLEKKNEITHKMIQAVQKWDESADRNINYRSLKPIIYLLRCHHCIEAQAWATWALASLTHKEDTNGKYIRLTISEGGYEALKELVRYNKAQPFIIDKAKKVLARVQPKVMEIQNMPNLIQ